MAFDRSPLIADSLSLSEARGYRDIYTYIYLIGLEFLLCLLVSKGVVVMGEGGNCRNFKTIRRISVAAEGLFMVAATRVPWRWLSYRPCPDNCSVFAMEGAGEGWCEGGGGRWLSVLVERQGEKGGL